MGLFKGSGVAIVTPFSQDGKVNFTSLENLVNYLVENGSDAIVACGTTGESATLSKKERFDIIKCCVSVCEGKVPVIAGTATNCTDTSIQFSKDAKKAGANGLLLVTPYYNKTTQDGACAHFGAILSKSDLPSILYNVPSRTGFNLMPETVFKLKQLDNVVGIKEASSNISQIAEIASMCDDDFSLYSGNDDQTIPVLSLGGSGVISVIANILPKETKDLISNFDKNKKNISLKMQLKMLPLIKALFSEVNPIPIKYALNLLGFEVGLPRLPLVEISDAKAQIVREEMTKFGII